MVDNTISRPASSPGQATMEQQAVDRATAYIRDNYYRTVTTDDIARAAHYSKFAFSRTFQRITGVTPGQYLTNFRFAEARRLLLYTNLSVSDICCSVGFTSVGTFSSKFKQTSGITATEYRQNTRVAGGLHPDQIPPEGWEPPQAETKEEEKQPPAA